MIDVVEIFKDIAKSTGKSIKIIEDVNFWPP